MRYSTIGVILLFLVLVPLQAGVILGNLRLLRQHRDSSASDPVFAHSAFSSSSVMVPMANCMRTCTRTGSLRRSSVNQT